MKAAPSRQHQEISFSLLMQIGTYLKDKKCKVYHAPFCVRFDCAKNNNDINNVVEPDISIICSQSKFDERGCQGAPDMIIEIVSPSTGTLDKLIKFNKYEGADVREYWIVEPDLKLVNVFILENGCVKKTLFICRLQRINPSSLRK